MADLAKPKGYDWRAWQEGRAYGRREADCPRWLFALRLAWWRIRDRKDYRRG